MGTNVSHSKPVTKPTRKDRGNAGAPPTVESIILMCFDKKHEEFSIQAAIDCLTQSGHVSGHKGSAALEVRTILDRMEGNRQLTSRISLKKGHGKLWRRT